MRFNSNCNDNLYRIIIMIMLCIILILVGYIIYDQINEHFNDRDPKLNELKNKLEILFNSKKSGEWSGNLEGLNDRKILNEIKLYVGSKSYTINKKKVYLCLTDENDEYYNINMLTYVLLHELSHVICDEIGHTQKFHDIFKEVLKEAKASEPVAVGVSVSDKDLSELVYEATTKPKKLRAVKPKTSILEEAQTIIYGDREKTYGHPAKNLKTIANMWTAYMNNSSDDANFSITAKDVAAMMMLVKVARFANDPSHRDNLVDVCGYAALIERCDEVSK